MGVKDKHTYKAKETPTEWLKAEIEEMEYLFKSGVYAEHDKNYRANGEFLKEEKYRLEQYKAILKMIEVKGAC